MPTSFEPASVKEEWVSTHLNDAHGLYTLQRAYPKHLQLALFFLGYLWLFLYFRFQYRPSPPITAINIRGNFSDDVAILDVVLFPPVPQPTAFSKWAMESIHQPVNEFNHWVKPFAAATIAMASFSSTAVSFNGIGECAAIHIASKEAIAARSLLVEESTTVFERVEEMFSSSGSAEALARF